MRFDENEWYEGFRVGTYQQRFTVTASLMTSQQRVGRVDAEVTVGPDRRVAVGGGTRSVLLTLVGDFAGYQELQSLAGRVLFIPSKDIGVFWSVSLLARGVSQNPPLHQRTFRLHKRQPFDRNCKGNGCCFQTPSWARVNVAK